MDKTGLLLRAYYERLHEKLENRGYTLIEKAEKILKNEIEKQGFKGFNHEKYEAYRDACVAFIDERIEAYNPTGVQYTFDNIRSKGARELEMQLDWYDSRVEFKRLVEAVREKAEPEMSDRRMLDLAEELIESCGAFPDTTIILTFEKAPALNKLPDYATARAIEEIIRQKNK